MKNTLRLPLKKQWFELTKNLVKGEDYRLPTDHWCRILLRCKEEIEGETWSYIVKWLVNPTEEYKSVKEFMDFFGLEFKKFDTTILTLGYPKNTDTDRIIEFENNGIEIGYGKPEWGAEPNKLYFIIKHGKRIR